MERSKGRTKGPTESVAVEEPRSQPNERSILTVVFTDIVGSTARAAELGDRAWRILLDHHDKIVRSELARFGGTEVDTAGDGFLATFETPATAISCATAILEAADQLGLMLRAGAHTGECEHRGKGLAGIAVHLAARVAGLAGAGEVLVSATVKDLAAGGDFEFTSRGLHTLKGVPGRHRIFEASRAKPRHTNPPNKKPTKPSTKRSIKPVSAAERISLLIVDDHPLWRQTVKSLIDDSGLVRRIFEAGDGDSALEAIREHKPDVVIMDMALPGMHGLDATRQVSEISPGTRVLVLSSSDDEEQVIEAVQAGASGYLLKSAGATEILEGVRRVHAGELVFPASLARLVLEVVRGDTPRRGTDPLAALSERETEVLSLMAEGQTNESIGKALFLSPKTVERHVTSIFTKLGLDPEAGGHRRVLAVIAYLSSIGSRKNPQ